MHEENDAKFGHPAMDYELCECGDFRINHEHGSGRCCFTTHGIPDLKLNHCSQFRGTGKFEQQVSVSRLSMVTEVACSALRRESAPVQFHIRQPEEPEIAWLVERRLADGQPLWLRWRGLPHIQWTPDATKADRYDWDIAASRDAKAICEFGTECIATEHVFLRNPMKAKSASEEWRDAYRAWQAKQASAHSNHGYECDTDEVFRDGYEAALASVAMMEREALEFGVAYATDGESHPDEPTQKTLDAAWDVWIEEKTARISNVRVRDCT